MQAHVPPITIFPYLPISHPAPFHKGRRLSRHRARAFGGPGPSDQPAGMGWNGVRSLTRVRHPPSPATDHIKHNLPSPLTYASPSSCIPYMAASSSSPSLSPPSHKPLQLSLPQQQQQQQQQSSSRRIPPPCWSHQETLALIDAYRSKWYSLNRGNLRASHWQEVADAVASTCCHVSPPKTSLQCRHKIEKLRKRYRAEKQRSLAAGPRGGPPSWPYFRKMDSMEVGPAASPGNSTSDDDDNDNNDNGGFDSSRAGNTRSLQRLLLNGSGQRVGAPSASARVKVEDGRESGGGGSGKKGSLSSGFDAVASAVRMVGEGFMRVEKMKMEMSREMERARMDMELKRTEMFLESQRRIFDAFLDGFRGEKRVKREN